MSDNENKIKSFDPDTAFFDLPIVRTTFAIASLTVIISSSLIGVFTHSEVSLDMAGFNGFIEMFRFPLGALALFGGLFAFYATNHRSEQNKRAMFLTNQSIELARVQNRFSNYYKHIEELESYFGRHVSGGAEEKQIKVKSEWFGFVECRFNSLHAKLYPRAKSKGINYTESITLQYLLCLEKIISSIANTNFSKKEDLVKLILNIDDACITIFRNVLDDCIVFNHRENAKIINAKFSEREILIPEARLKAYLIYIVEKIKILREILCFEESFDEDGLFRDIILHTQNVINDIPEIGVGGESNLSFHTPSESWDEVHNNIHHKSSECRKIWAGVKSRPEIVALLNLEN